ncbi:MAG TPA: hypothetical protein VFR34_07200, partial [Paracoccaceae bacterium]|nr:hypothetical protein [Paracoccaceae bacterium]
MTMRALVLLCFLALPAAAQDWRDLRWGMDRAEIEAVMGDSLELLDVPREYGGGLSAPFFLEGAEIGGLPFRAWLQLGVDGGLRQILFERRRGEARPLDFSTLDEGLAAELGPPDRRCEVPLRPGRPAVREAVW